MSSPADRPVQVDAARPMLHLERDPCPGDVARVREVAASLRARAATLGTGAVAAAGWQPAAWRDEAAHRVAVHVGRLVAAAQDLRRSLQDAADGLDGWAQVLGELQGEADALDHQAWVLHRRWTEQAAIAAEPPEPLTLYEAATAGFSMPGAPPPRPSRQEVAAQRRDEAHAELEQVLLRVDELFVRYAAVSRGHSRVLDGSAPRTGTASAAWRGSWDLGHDRASWVVREHATLMHGWARFTGGASTVAGLLALAPPLALPAGVASVALSGSAAGTRALLAVGADGPEEDVSAAATGAALGVVGGAASAVRVVDGAAGVVRASRAGQTVSWAATAKGTHDEALSWLPDDHGGDRWQQAVPLRDGGQVRVSAHDVAKPWQTGDGATRRATEVERFTAVATVTVPLSALAPGAGTATTARPVPRPVGRPVGPQAGPPSGERDDQHRVRRGGL